MRASDACTDFAVCGYASAASLLRNCGIGGYLLEKVIEKIYNDYGIRPIALGVHKDNIGAEHFYLNHGFKKTEVMEENDYYYLRYPNKK